MQTDDSPSLREIAEAYLGFLAAGRACPEHVANCRRTLDRIIGYVGTAEPMRIYSYQRERLAGEMASRRKKIPSNRTINIEVGTLRACLNWAVNKAQILASHKLSKIEPLPERESDKKRAPHPLTDDELARFTATSRIADAGRLVAQTPMWRLFLQVGVRRGDALALGPGDLREAILTIRSATTKGRRMREIPIPPDLAAELELPLRTPEGMLWSKWNKNNIGRMLQALLVRAGIPRRDAAGRSLYVHALRASAATTMHRRRASIPAIAAMLGHANPATTMKLYIKPGVETVRDEMGPVWNHPSEKKSGTTLRLLDEG